MLQSTDLCLFYRIERQSRQFSCAEDQKVLPFLFGHQIYRDCWRGALPHTHPQRMSLISPLYAKQIWSRYILCYTSSLCYISFSISICLCSWEVGQYQARGIRLTSTPPWACWWETTPPFHSSTSSWAETLKKRPMGGTRDTYRPGSLRMVHDAGGSCVCVATELKSPLHPQIDQPDLLIPTEWNSKKQNSQTKAQVVFPCLLFFSCYHVFWCWQDNVSKLLWL